MGRCLVTQNEELSTVVYATLKQSASRDVKKLTRIQRQIIVQGEMRQMLDVARFWNLGLVDTPLKRRRLQMGLYQRELAERCRLPFRTYLNYERGARSPSGEALQRLREVTGLDLGALTAPEQYLAEVPGFLAEHAGKSGRAKRSRCPRT